MAGNVNIYYSTDTGAPALTGRAGSLYNLLKACLVTGYGSKAAAGWTNPYSGNNQGVFTMASGGTGFSFYINDNAPSVANFTNSGYTPPAGNSIFTNFISSIVSFVWGPIIRLF